MSLDNLISETRKLLATAQSKDALKLLKKHRNTYTNSVPFLQLLGEVYLETGNVEKAYTYFEQACNLDPDAGEGAEKFLYMGQIVGGRRGLELIDHGIASLTTKFEQDQDITIVKKLNQGIFAEIEIWMTDLCMDPEAEEKCNELIAQSLGLDDTNPESWSLLASIRISQQRIEEAQEGVKKSWELFEKRKLTLEENNQDQDQDQDASSEYVELIQPLLTLSRFAIELSLYELGASIASNVRDIDEDNAESYYLEGFAHYLYIKKTQYDSLIGEFDPDKFEQFTIDSTVGFEDNAKLAKKAFDTVMKISTYQEDIMEEILAHTQELLQQLSDVEVDDNIDDNIDNINEDNWEDIIESDEN